MSGLKIILEEHLFSFFADYWHVLEISFKDPIEERSSKTSCIGHNNVNGPLITRRTDFESFGYELYFWTLAGPYQSFNLPK